MPLFDSLEKGLIDYYRSCELCPRRCRVDRTTGEVGFCGEASVLRIGTIEAHMGEEPPISGTNGSGTVFLTGCSLHCRTCQNLQISQQGMGRKWSVDEVVDRVTALREVEGIHNVNFVTPDHYFPHTVAIVRRLRKLGVDIPTVYNVSGYQRIESLRLIEVEADIYLPDFKYGDEGLARCLCRSPDYAAVALDAVSQMVRQKGYLDTSVVQENDGVERGDRFLLARRGVLVRHLILPGHVENSLQVLSMLFAEFGAALPVSLMSQYVPVHRFHARSPLNRRVTLDEFQTVLAHGQELGFRSLFVQWPRNESINTDPFLPDFCRVHPFPGNVRRRN